MKPAAPVTNIARFGIVSPEARGGNLPRWSGSTCLAAVSRVLQQPVCPAIARLALKPYQGSEVRRTARVALF
jgi:hypothetical protein